VTCRRDVFRSLKDATTLFVRGLWSSPKVRNVDVESIRVVFHQTLFPSPDQGFR